MKRQLFLPLLYIIGLVTVLGFAALNRPAAEPVTLTQTRTSPMSIPANYQETFVQYLTVDRSDGTVRHIYIQPQVLENLQQGEPLPVGTQIIIEAYTAERNIAGLYRRDSSNRLIAGEMFTTIHAAEKRTEWSPEAIAAATPLNGWNFETFDSVTLQPAFENRNDCFTCHDASAFRRDFIFTRRIIDEFVASNGTAQYFFCNRPDRAPCL
jgi:hypothetical protein